jgi:hypothetical protein
MKRALIVCSNGSTERCSRMAFCLSYADGSIMRNPVSSASGKRQPRNVVPPEVPDYLEGNRYPLG